MSKSILEVEIGEAFSSILVSRYILNEFPKRKYHFLSVEEYSRLLKSETNKANNIYFIELLYRCELASIAAIKRQLDWISQIELSRENFIQYCSSMRGLMECAGDTYDGLSKVSRALAENNTLISRALDEKLQEPAHFQELEDILFHFIYASKTIKNNHDTPFKPKKPFEYVQLLEKSSSLKFYALYEFFCNVVHPAGESLAFNFEEENGCLVWSGKRDKELVCHKLNQDREIIVELLLRGLNPPLVLLKTLLLFERDEFKYPFLEKISTSNIPEYLKCKSLFNK